MIIDPFTGIPLMPGDLCRGCHGNGYFFDVNGTPLECCCDGCDYCPCCEVPQICAGRDDEKCPRNKPHNK